jgi:signal peptidase II
MNPRIQSIAIIIFVVLLDRVTKMYIRTRFSPWDTVPVIPRFFNIVHTENPGAAFGMFSESTSNLRQILLVAVSMAVIAIIGTMLWRGAAENALTRMGFSLVLGGALGNLWDRVYPGTVTDFLQFFFGSYEFPSFNVADSAITIGACLLVLDLLRRKTPAVTSPRAES